MKSKKPQHLLLKIPLALMSIGLSLLVGYQLMSRIPAREQQRAHKHSIELWGTSPLKAHLLSRGEVKPSSGGPFRNYVFQFTDKFGQSENISGDFLLKSPPPDIVDVWQKQSTGDVFLPKTYDHNTQLIGALSPYNDGESTKSGIAFLGLIGTVAVMLGSWLLAFLLYMGLLALTAEYRTDRRLKKQSAATAR